MSHYIFSTNHQIEEQRLDILNRSCNENTLNYLTSYIRPGMKVLECGFGHGQISDEINKIPNIKYLGFENDIYRMHLKCEKNKFTYGDLLNLEDIKELKRKKFDVIYMRWILAYLPQFKVSEVLKDLHQRLKKGGKLILEECDLYSAYLTKNGEKINIPIFDRWIDLSRLVQTMINSCNFRMGSELPEIVAETFKKTDIMYSDFQPVLKGRDKEIITLGLKSSAKSLIEKRIITENEIIEMISNIEYAIINNDDIDLHYVKNTNCVISKED
jgi:SAM-dependent methyltransferase